MGCTLTAVVVLFLAQQLRRSLDILCPSTGKGLVVALQVPPALVALSAERLTCPGHFWTQSILSQEVWSIMDVSMA